MNTTTLWALQHRSGCWLTIDPEEPAGRGWSDHQAQALKARDPILFAARIREAVPPTILQTCRLVPVAGDG